MPAALQLLAAAVQPAGLGIPCLQPHLTPSTLYALYKIAPVKVCLWMKSYQDVQNPALTGIPESSYSLTDPCEVGEIW
jgi:hypothetical protein